MRTLRIGVWMTGLNVGLVLLVAAGLVPGGLLLLRALAADGASARVQLAAVGAAEGVKVVSDEVLTGARLLAERPTLQRLAREGRREELASFLAQFADTSQLDGCAVWAQGELVAAAPPDARWASIAAGASPGTRYLAGDAGAPPCVAALVPLADESGAAAITFRWLDGVLARKLAEQVGLPVRIAWEAGGGDAATFVAGEGWRARRFVRAPDAPVQNGAGTGALAVLVELPASLVAADLRPVQRSFVLVTAIALLAAAGAAALAARYLSRPLTELQAAARSIGAGDLSTPVPAVRGVEAGALAATMEGMRRRIQRESVELRQREAEGRALLEGMVEGVFAVGEDRRIDYLNPQAARLLGIDIAAATGRFCGDVLRPIGKNGVRPCENACPIVHARSRGSSRAVEHLDLPGGRRTIVVTSAPPAFGRQVQLARDETEIEAARRSRDAVLANVSHELKTPLSAQMASIQLLQEALDEAAPRAPQAIDLVDSLERSTLRLSGLIDNLLESVRIETGRGSLRSVPVDLRAVLAEAEAMTDPLVRQRRQEVVVELPAALAPVAGDPAQLTQVFVNLLANANKYSPEGSTIRIGGASDATATTVWVEDQGPGIPAAERRSVFEHYYRADPSAAEGMGLGLWIVKSIVERHGGSVEASASAGGGARFTVRLPAWPAGSAS